MSEQRAETQPSVLVVGAGAIGVSIAVALVRNGHRVTIVDGGEAGTGTTDGSYAWVNANSKFPAGYAELNLLGLRTHERWSAAAARPWFHQCGGLQVLTAPEQLAEAEDSVARYRDAGYPAHLLTAAQVVEREPGLRGDGVVGAVSFPLEGWADTSVMVAALLQEALDRGAEFRPHHRAIDLTGGGAVVVGPDGGPQRLDADVTVLAAGNGIRSLAAGSGFRIPILPTAGEPAAGDPTGSTPTIGMTCSTSAVAGLPRSMVHSPEVSFRPAPNGGVVLTDHPTASSWDADGQGLWGAPAQLLRRARRLCPALETAEIATVHLGHRILPEDGLTIADWVDPGHRYFAAATHSGITLAPHLGEAIADEIGGGWRSPSLRDFGLDRFHPHAPSRPSMTTTH